VPAQSANLKGLPSALRNQVSLALKTSVRVLDHAMVPSSPELAGLLGIEAGEQVLRVIRVRSDSSSPISYSVCHVPKDLADLLPRQQIRALPISTILASSGLPLDRVRENLSASIANMEIAKCLDVEVGSPLLSLVRTVSTSDKRVVEHLRVLYRPDRYEYRVEYSANAAHDSASSWQASIADLTT
jgi:GntR family transcriptional regulator